MMDPHRQRDDADRDPGRLSRIARIIRTTRSTSHLASPSPPSPSPSTAAGTTTPAARNVGGQGSRSRSRSMHHVKSTTLTSTSSNPSGLSSRDHPRDDDDVDNTRRWQKLRWTKRSMDHLRSLHRSGTAVIPVQVQLDQHAVAPPCLPPLPTAPSQQRPRSASPVARKMSLKGKEKAAAAEQVPISVDDDRASPIDPDQASQQLLTVALCPSDGQPRYLMPSGRPTSDSEEEEDDQVVLVDDAGPPAGAPRSRTIRGRTLEDRPIPSPSFSSASSSSGGSSSTASTSSPPSASSSRKGHSSSRRRSIDMVLPLPILPHHAHSDTDAALLLVPPRRRWLLNRVPSDPSDSAYGSMDDVSTPPTITATATGNGHDVRKIVLPSATASSSTLTSAAPSVSAAPTRTTASSSSTSVTSPPGSDSGFSSSSVSPSPVSSSLNLAGSHLEELGGGRTRALKLLQVPSHSRSKSLGQTPYAYGRRRNRVIDEETADSGSRSRDAADEGELPRRKTSVRTIDLSDPSPSTSPTLRYRPPFFADEDDHVQTSLDRVPSWVHAARSSTQLKRRHTSPSASSHFPPTSSTGRTTVANGQYYPRPAHHARHRGSAASSMLRTGSSSPTRTRRLTLQLVDPLVGPPGGLPSSPRLGRSFSQSQPSVQDPQNPTNPATSPAPRTFPPLTRVLLPLSLSLTFVTYLLDPLAPSPTSWTRHLPWPPTAAAPEYLLRSRHETGPAEWINALVGAPLLTFSRYAGAGADAQGSVLLSLMVGLAQWALFATVEDSLRRGSWSRDRRRKPASTSAVSTVQSAVLVAGLWVLTVGVRVALGFGLGRATGWQWPGLFFGGAVHEWSCGVGPLLWALLPLQALLPAASSRSLEPRLSITASPRLGSRHRRKLSGSRTLSLASAHHHAFRRSASSLTLTLRSRPSVSRWFNGPGSVVAQLAIYLGLLFVSPAPSLWWSISGLLSGSIVALLFGGLIVDEAQPIKGRTLQRPAVGKLRKLGRRASRVGSVFGATAVALVVVSALREARTSHGAVGRPLPHGVGGTVSPSGADDNAASSLYALHPTHSQLLTVLLMTAPRPGHPDFLLKTLATYLASLPDPAQNPIAASRLSLVVYTHFADHPVFTQARDEVYKNDVKAQHYVKWIQRIPDDGQDRLDQRLHLARALRLVTQDGGISRDAAMPAYVMLAEDDFPLCPDHALSASSFASPLSMIRSAARGNFDSYDDADHQLTYASSWSTISRLIVSTNALMPDLPSMEPASGHCGVFVGTGGSGLIMRGWLAAKMPGLLLGTDVEAGWERDRRALTADEVAKEAPPTDVLIQDCLMGNVPGCEACAAPSLTGAARQRRPSQDSSAAGYDTDFFVRSPIMSTLRQWYLGLASPSLRPATARDAFVAPGDRWGKSGLATSERLLMRHLGYNASTIPGRSYKREEWDCGWRHPFNGDPSVLTLSGA